MQKIDSFSRLKLFRGENLFFKSHFFPLILHLFQQKTSNIKEYDHLTEQTDHHNIQPCNDTLQRANQMLLRALNGVFLRKTQKINNCFVNQVICKDYTKGERKRHFGSPTHLAHVKWDLRSGHDHAVDRCETRNVPTMGYINTAAQFFVTHFSAFQPCFFISPSIFGPTIGL